MKKEDQIESEKLNSREEAQQEGSTQRTENHVFVLTIEALIILPGTVTRRKKLSTQRILKSYARSCSPK